MKKTVKKIAIAAAYQVLSGVRISKLEPAEQSLIGKALLATRKTAKEYLDHEAEMRKMLQPNNIEELGIIEAKRETATAEERVKYQIDMGRYNRALSEQLKGVSDEEVEIEIEPISFDVLSKLAVANDMPLGNIMPVADVFES